MKKFFDVCTLALASGLFLSHPFARIRKGKPLTGAGLVGSLWGIFLWRFLPYGSVPALSAIVIGTVFAILISHRAEKLYGRHDDARIVIDETVGMWVTLLFVPQTFLFFVIGFVAFRVCDVLKFPWGRAVSRMPGGVGIVADDIVAGITANILLQSVRILIGS